eukprot:CAMPEP_0195269022 /NCGR_PEP_ID=MMETSP0706-20130129/13516_1 /TAXON_ID=33640 /ORGANISM="Asterionellopsis glacialis, Strain CCMP134" /LENGTH=77 /DNA_ID=CAMNT_0040324041 /DNA_START=126 /DNA_END=356 /DNA_ORIENTATION=-
MVEQEGKDNVNSDGGDNKNVQGNSHVTDSTSRSIETAKQEEEQSSTTISDNKKKERCPWPFIFFHDPTTGFQDWQTW